MRIDCEVGWHSCAFRHGVTVLFFRPMKLNSHGLQVLSGFVFWDMECV